MLIEEMEGMVMDGKITVLNKYLSQLESFGFSGSILVGAREEIVFQQAYGYSHIEQKIRSEVNTIYDMGSITKPFTAVAIMKLIQDGQLTLDDRLVDYLQHPNIDWPEEKQDITLHHLLTHTAGIEDTVQDDYHAESVQEVLHRIAIEPLLTPPGTAYRYANDGFTLLAMILEQVTGQEYEAFMQENIFEPAGLKNTGYVYPNWNVELIAHGYVNFENQGHSLQKNYPTWSLKGNGGMLTTVGDMFRWQVALSNYVLLNKETTQLMFTPYMKDSGCGWEILQRNGQKIVQHDGASYYGSSACYYHNMDTELTIIVFTNQSYYHMALIKPVMHNILKIMEDDLRDVQLIEKINTAPPLTLEVLPETEKNQQVCYLLQNNTKAKIHWGSYYGLISMESEELFTLLLSEEERQYMKLSSSLAADMIQDHYASFRACYLADDMITAQREEAIIQRFRNYATRHGEINHFSIYGVSPSLIMEDTTEVRIELKNQAVADALYMYLFWTKDHHLKFAGFASGMKDESLLLAKPKPDFSFNNSKQSLICLRLQDHTYSSFDICRLE